MHYTCKAPKDKSKLSNRIHLNMPSIAVHRMVLNFQNSRRLIKRKTLIEHSPLNFRLLKVNLLELLMSLFFGVQLNRFQLIEFQWCSYYQVPAWNSNFFNRSTDWTKYILNLKNWLCGWNWVLSQNKYSEKIKKKMIFK